MRSGSDRIVTCLVALGLLALGVLPEEHVHTRVTDAGRFGDIIHRHLDPLHPPAADEPVADDHADHEARWLDAVVTGPERPVSRVAPDTQIDLDRQPVLLQQQDASPRALPFVRASVHDPPGVVSNSLRGPPLSVA